MPFGFVAFVAVSNYLRLWLRGNLMLDMMRIETLYWDIFGFCIIVIAAAMAKLTLYTATLRIRGLEIKICPVLETPMGDLRWGPWLLHAAWIAFIVHHAQAAS